RLQVDDAAHARVDGGNVERAARLERNVISGIAKRREEGVTARLRERLAAGDADVRGVEPASLAEPLADRAPVAARERVGRIAIPATQRAARQADEDARPTARERLALNRAEDLGDAEALLGGVLGYGVGRRTQPAPCSRDRRCSARRAAVE